MVMGYFGCGGVSVGTGDFVLEQVGGRSQGFVMMLRRSRVREEVEWEGGYAYAGRLTGCVGPAWEEGSWSGKEQQRVERINSDTKGWSGQWWNTKEEGGGGDGGGGEGGWRR